MRSLHPNPSTHPFHCVKLNDARKKNILFFLFIILSLLSFADMPRPDFKNTALEYGMTASGFESGYPVTQQLNIDTNGQPRNTMLPVRLSSFTASLQSNKAELNWSSVAERDFSLYVVQRSANGKDFSDVTVIFANGDVHAGATYNYADQLAADASGSVYYRLKMVDDGGLTQYSPVKVVKIGSGSNTATAAASVNPVASELTIMLSPDNQSAIRLIIRAI